MIVDLAVRRAQLCAFLANAFLYPHQNWLDWLPDVEAICRELGIEMPPLDAQNGSLAELQAEYRRIFGVSGSLCYETEYGLPHEFRQSQELSDLAGFYRAFGFRMGGAVRERPDHLAVELEFLYLLSLKEALAIQDGDQERVSICQEAQRKFLRDHLGGWIGWFVRALERAASGSTPSAMQGLYHALAHLVETFVRMEASRLGIALESKSPSEVPPTPFPQDFSCQMCTAFEESGG